MDINYELYKVFYYVATTLSFSEASRQLFISQSAVSQSIKTLEKKLDQILFIRSTKKVQLTPEGEILLRHIEPALNLIKRLLRKQPVEPETITTDGLASYGAALDQLELRHLHRPGRLRCGSAWKRDPVSGVIGVE